jgi:hypothetical protein
MCSPAPIAAASLLIQVGSAIAGHKAEGEQAEANNEAARQQRIMDILGLTQREVEEGARTSKFRRSVQRDASEASGQARASAAAAGVSGGALNAILGDIEGSEGRALQDINDQYVATIDQLQLEKSGAQVREANRFDEGPSALATGLRIGGSVTNYLTTRQRISASTNLAED